LVGCAAPLDQVIAGVRRGHASLDIWFCLDTLEYLRRGGRIGAAQAMVGTALKIKPILTFGTEIAPVGRVRTHRRALERMLAYLEELHERGATDWIVQHAQAPADAARLVAEGTALFGFAPLFCTEVGPVLGAHLGSGMLVGGMKRPAGPS
jgi:DegV family protein with EDD domain